MTGDIIQLAADIETAKGPSRLLDCRIWLLVGAELGSSFSLGERAPIKPAEIVNGRWFGSAIEKYPEDIDGVARSWRVPSFTTSRDVADLIMPNDVGHVTWHVVGKKPAVSTQIEGRWSDYSPGWNDAMAMAAAALRARHAIAGRAGEA